MKGCEDDPGALTLSDDTFVSPNFENSYIFQVVRSFSETKIIEKDYIQTSTVHVIVNTNSEHSTVYL